jgi:hypothetical protein
MEFWNVVFWIVVISLWLGYKFSSEKEASVRIFDGLFFVFSVLAILGTVYGIVKFVKWAWQN